MIPLFVVVSSFAFALPNATALALADHPGVAGAASALLGVIQFVSGAAIAPLVGVAGTDTAVPMAVVMSVLGHRRGCGAADHGPRAGSRSNCMTLVTLAAGYGTGGSRIAPAVAELLGVPLLDRARPVPATERLDELLIAQDPGDDAPPRLSTAAALGLCWGTPAGITLEALLPDDDERRASEQAVRDRAATGEGVILGRAAAVLLRDDPRALHVRLDGPVERARAAGGGVAGDRRGRGPPAPGAHRPRPLRVRRRGVRRRSRLPRALRARARRDRDGHRRMRGARGARRASLGGAPEHRDHPAHPRLRPRPRRRVRDPPRRRQPARRPARDHHRRRQRHPGGGHAATRCASARWPASATCRSRPARPARCAASSTPPPTCTARAASTARTSRSPTSSSTRAPATELMADVLRGRRRAGPLVPTGPLTNVAVLLQEAPDVREQIGEIVWMGGSFGRGNRTPYAEFNAWVDPDAAQIVVDSGVPFTLVGLHLTHQALATPEVVERIRGGRRARSSHVAADWLGLLQLDVPGDLGLRRAAARPGARSRSRSTRRSRRSSDAFLADRDARARWTRGRDGRRPVRPARPPAERARRASSSTSTASGTCS